MSVAKYCAKLSNRSEVKVMSRAGKYPVKLSEGVSVAIADNVLVVKGPKGEIK